VFSSHAAPPALAPSRMITVPKVYLSRRRDFLVFWGAGDGDGETTGFSVAWGLGDGSVMMFGVEMGFQAAFGDGSLASLNSVSGCRCGEQ